MSTEIETRRLKLRKVLSGPVAFIQTCEDLRHGTKLGYNVYLNKEVVDNLIEILLPREENDGKAMHRLPE